MNYLVHDNTERGKVFASFEEASKYSDWLTRKTKCLYTITETRRKVTHKCKI